MSSRAWAGVRVVMTTGRLRMISLKALALVLVRRIEAERIRTSARRFRPCPGCRMCRETGGSLSSSLPFGGTVLCGPSHVRH